MNRLFLLFIIMFFASIIYSQEIIYEEEYKNLPFPLRIDNSGIYSIASFDVENGVIYFSSFNSKSIFKYTGENYYKESGSLNVEKDFVAGFNTSNLRLNKGASESTVKETITYKKNFRNGNSFLRDDGGDIIGTAGEEIKIIVPNKNELVVEFSLKNVKDRITLSFPSNLACADLVGIDKAGNYFILVEKYISEIPLNIEREVYTVSKDGEILSQLVLPNIKYLYTIKDLQIDEDGNLYHLITLKEKAQIVKWKNLTTKNQNKLYYPNEYNYELHFNYFTPTNEISIQAQTINKNMVTKVGRTKALQIAETYVLHQYECKPNNLAASDVTAPDDDVVRTPSWLIIGANARLPYKWGGFNTIEQFDAGLANGKYAGDIVTSGVSSFALGVDCSGYVSRCWQLNEHVSTADMPGITTKYSSWENLKPGDAIHKVGHVRLFIKRNSNGSFKVAEAAGRNWDVSYWSFSAKDLENYTPRYYNGMEDNYNSQQSELLSTEMVTENLVRIKWRCDTANILGYRVYHSTDGNTWNMILDENDCKSTSTTVNINNAINFFRVSSVKNDSPNFSESNWSNVLGISSYASNKKALIVDGFEREVGSWQGAGHSFVTKYGKALGIIKIDFISIKNSELQNGNYKLEDYNYIFWILGDESTINETFNSTEQQLVKNYLNDGGNLFVSGSEIGWDLDFKGDTQDKSFYNNYLKSSFISDDAVAYSVKGVANSSLSDCIMNFGQTYEEDYPDEIATKNGSKLCMQYSNGKGAGIEYTGYFGTSTIIGKIIYLAFPLESTADDKSFNNVILKGIDYFNSVKVSVKETEHLVYNFSLEQNYPNPFNPETTIRYQLPQNGFVLIKLFDSLGREVASLVNEEKTAGQHQVNINGSELSSGIYFYQLHSGHFVQTRKLVLLK